MESTEKISDYFTRILTLTNQMKVCGEKVTDQLIVEKVMCTLTPKFDYIVVAIEESKDLESMKVEELQGSLEAHEQRLLERSFEKDSNQALQAQTMKFKGGDKGKKCKDKGKWKHSRNGNAGGSNQKQDHAQSEYEHGDNSRKKGDGGYRDKGGKKRFDRRKIQCFNCQKYGHFADECKSGNKGQKRRNNDEAHLAHDNSDSESDLVVLMTTSDHDSPANPNSWYLDTGCSNHMTCHKEWLTNLDSSKKSKIRFADFRTLTAEGIGTVAIKRKDGQVAQIQEVLYVPGMKCNLLSLGQLVEKGFSVVMKNDNLKMFDPDQRLILRASLSSNRTFQVDIQGAKVHCLKAATNDESWLWHSRYGHLNFKGLSQLESKHLVKGLPKITVPEKYVKVV